MSVISTKPTVSQFVGVSRDQVVDHGVHGKFRVLVYGAYNAMGLIGPENNGIAILQEQPASVVADSICLEDSGYFGPSQRQLAEFDRIVSLDWEDFKNVANESPRARFTL